MADASKEDIYKMSPEEEAVFQKYVLAGDDASKMSLAEKWILVKAVNTSAKLSIVGGIGLLRTEHENKQGHKTVKETLYAPRGCANQLARLHQLSVANTEKVISDGIVRFGARATGPTGRYMDGTGVCSLTQWGKPLQDDRLANKIMHCETKAQRRAILNYCGLGYLDETEAAEIQGADHVSLDAPPPVETKDNRGKKADPKPEQKPEEKKPAATSGAATTPKQEQTSATSADSQKSSESASPTQTSSSAVDPNAFCGEERAAQFVQSAKLVWEQKDLTKKMFETYGVRWGGKDHVCEPGACRHTTFTNAKWEQAMNEVAQELAKRAKQ